MKNKTKYYIGWKRNFIELISYNSTELSINVTTGKPKNIYKWNAICHSCNNIFIVNNITLNAKVKSCGCEFKKHKKSFSKTFAGSNKLNDGEAGFNVLYNEYIRSAKRRSLEFIISIELFRTLSKKKCHYCGIEPFKISYDSFSKKTTGYIYNGLDRKDPKKGYTNDNIVTCCSDCNYAKKSMEYNQFLNFIERLKTHTINEN
jgi:hypothetical protein